MFSEMKEISHFIGKMIHIARMKALAVMSSTFIYRLNGSSATDRLQYPYIRHYRPRGVTPSPHSTRRPPNASLPSLVPALFYPQQHLTSCSPTPSGRSISQPPRPHIREKLNLCRASAQSPGKVHDLGGKATAFWWWLQISA